MKYNIITYKSFDKEAKRLAKKYKSFKIDLMAFVAELRDNPYVGVDLGGGLRKIRLSITSKGKGKSGGARVITFNCIISDYESTIGLLYIYDKSECENISDKEIKDLMRKNGLI
ncbi:MAG: type II toxin-antitoxin system RelE/ParE family toxin [Prevotella sp.]|jgi:hypothetical protein|nr:type II toxin-antitoxin system RelE/ParE family toxin [Prevotella sp.]